MFTRTVCEPLSSTRVWLWIYPQILCTSLKVCMVTAAIVYLCTNQSLEYTSARMHGEKCLEIWNTILKFLCSYLHGENVLVKSSVNHGCDIFVLFTKHFGKKYEIAWQNIVLYRKVNFTIFFCIIYNFFPDLLIK